MDQLTDLILQNDLSYKVDVHGATLEASFVGPYEKCISELANNYRNGQVESESGSNRYLNAVLQQFGVSASGSAGDGFLLKDSRNWYCSSMTVKRKEGGVGILHVTARGARTVVLVGLDFETFSRPIMGFVFSDESLDDSIKRASKVEMWKNMKDTNHLSEYLRYQYKIPSDSTLTPKSTDESYYLVSDRHEKSMANKIRNGIENFDRYLPVLTITLQSRRMPTKSNFSKKWTTLSLVGTQGEIDLSSWGGLPDGLISKLVSEVRDTLKRNFDLEGDGKSLTWVICGDNLTMDEELIYTRTVQYRGVSEADIDLYPDRATINV